MRNALTTLFMLAALSGASGPVNAEGGDYYVCEFETPSDGFIALRKEPSRKAPIIARMSPEGFFLMVKKNDEAVAKGDWFYVVYAAPEMIGDDERIERSGLRGWMHKSLSAGCDR